MNRKSFRLPQAALWLLTGIVQVDAVEATQAAVAQAEAAQAEAAQAEEETATPRTEPQQTEGEQERSVVYSLRDYQRAETTASSPEEYLSDYSDVDALGQDGIARSLEGPDVVITAGTERTVYEYRQGGQLRLVKIIPRIGRPYYLVPADPTRGFGDLDQANRLLPQWKIIEF